MQKHDAFKIGLVQMAMTSDVDQNLRSAISGIEEAAGSDARIVCLPELFRSQYFCQREDTRYFDLAEPIPGPTTQALANTARKAHVTIIAPIFERRSSGIYHNSAVVLNADGQIAGVYRKMHIPDDPAYYEKYYFTPGDLGFRAFETEFGRIGVLICWDQWYPEAARIATLMGAQILFYPTAIGWHAHEKETYGADQLDAWQTIQRSHAIANGVYVAAVNRVGSEKLEGGGTGIEFWGSSFLADPHGVIVSGATSNRAEIVLGEINPGRIEDVRRNWPFLRDRRIDAYSGLSSRLLDEEPWEREKP